ncbi:MAG: hypothetical protein R3199_07875, partial [Gemmatimonadota bacterium]|nr:hypothetical protein [Gemmatimonadota bacterium]
MERERDRDMERSSAHPPSRRSYLPGDRFESSYEIEESNRVEESGAGFDPHRIMNAIRRNVWLFVGVVVACVAIAGYLVQREVQLHEATAVIRLVDWNASIVGEAAEEGPTPVAQVDPILSEIMVIQIREVLGEAADQAGLRLFESTTNRPVAFVEDASVTLAAEESAEIRLVFGPRELSYESGDARGTAPYGAAVEVAGARFTIAERPQEDAATIKIVPYDRATT